MKNTSSPFRARHLWFVWVLFAGVLGFSIYCMATMFCLLQHNH